MNTGMFRKPYMEPAMLGGAILAVVLATLAAVAPTPFSDPAIVARPLSGKSDAGLRGFVEFKDNRTAMASLIFVAERPFRDCPVCPQMVALPKGDFIMGDTTGVSDGDERPAHHVNIDYRLAVGRFEVTLEEWDACVADQTCRRPMKDAGRDQRRLPIVNVSPDDVKDYLVWLGAKTGKPYRLLSEAEWEYAARAGSESAWFPGNDPARLCAFGNGADRSSAFDWRNIQCSDGHVAAAFVGSFAPNAFGLHDMLGNVWEWTEDCWHSSYEGAPTDGSAWTTGCDREDRVLRGGAYSVDVDKLRSTYRYHASSRMPFFGFRVARPLD